MMNILLQKVCCNECVGSFVVCLVGTIGSMVVVVLGWRRTKPKGVSHGNYMSHHDWKALLARANHAKRVLRQKQNAKFDDSFHSTLGLGLSLCTASLIQSFSFLSRSLYYKHKRTSRIGCAKIKQLAVIVTELSLFINRFHDADDRRPCFASSNSSIRNNSSHQRHSIGVSRLRSRKVPDLPRRSQQCQ
jgi:hypothetical protein